MRDEKVALAELTESNWYECCSLGVAEEQKGFLESNAVSIVQAKFEPTLKPYVITYEGKTAGFAMFNSVKEELDAYWMYRLMVDKAFQGRGIVRSAALLMINEMALLPGAKKIVAGYNPENHTAHKLYSALGFVDEGDRFGREMAVVKYMYD